VGGAAEPTKAGPFPDQGFVGAEVVTLKRAVKTFQCSQGHGVGSALVKEQHHVAPWHSKEPQVSLSGLALDLGIEHLDRRFVDLQVIPSLHPQPHPIHDQAQEPGHVLDPLHHLLARDRDSMAFAEDSLQSVEGQVVIVLGEENEDRQSQPQDAPGQEPGRQGRDGNPAAPAVATPFDAHRPAHDQPGRDQIHLLADFLADLVPQLSTVLAGRVGRFQNGRLDFQVDGNLPRLALAPRRRGFLRLGGLGLLGQDVLDVGGRTLLLLVQIPDHGRQFARLFLRHLLGLGTKEHPLELLDQGLLLRQGLGLLRQGLGLLGDRFLRPSQSLFQLESFLNEGGQIPLRLPQKFRAPVHAQRRSRNFRWSGWR